MTVTVKHAKTNAISDWTQAQLDEQIALGNFAEGTVLADIVLPSDWNNDHTLTGVGTMAEQNANSVAITGGSVNGTTIGATTASTGRFTSVTTPSVTATTNDLTLSAISTGAVNLNTAGGTGFKISDNGAMTSYWETFGGTGTNILFANGSTANISALYKTKGTGGHQFTTAGSNSNTQLNVANTASAVNYVQVTGGATGTYPAILGTGSDGTVGLQLAGKGGTIDFRNNGIGTATQFSVAFTASSVNYLNATGSGVTGNAPRLFALGTDTNISMAFQPKGTGAIDLAAGSSGVNISNGGTVTAITVTNGGTTAYTSHPTPAITAPTTAGGVQAVATSNLFYNSALASTTIVNGGTGYTVGNLLTVVGGTSTATAQFTVSAVSSGVVTAITGASGGTYSVIPTGTLSVTGGSGTGFTFTINGWAVRSLNITNAGSGYIEQPTVTFSGGGGSGASAYASVGSNVTVKSIGSSIQFVTPSGEQVRINDAGTTPDSYIALKGGSATSNGVYITAAGTARNMYISSGAGQAVQFFTNGEGSAMQFRVSHTASAVNYVQVTGGATTVRPLISVQGSDTNIGMTYGAKGTGIHAFTNGNGTQLVLQTGSTSSVNRIEITPTVTGSAPILSAGGSDTNIDLALTPKGTGLVRFGTYVAGALTATGYINIKAADGTIYKVLVST